MPPKGVAMRDPVGFELLLLTILLDQPSGAYGIMIMNRVEERTGKVPSVGAVYKSLDRLQEKGFIGSWWGEPTAQRGGRRKRYYKLTGSGQEAVRRARQSRLAPSRSR
jgi:DNA-binding PadR family transcriptional regulator